MVDGHENAEMQKRKCDDVKLQYSIALAILQNFQFIADGFSLVWVVNFQFKPEGGGGRAINI